jgi:hypothetical protein
LALQTAGASRCITIWRGRFDYLVAEKRIMEDFYPYAPATPSSLHSLSIVIVPMMDIWSVGGLMLNFLMPVTVRPKSLSEITLVQIRGLKRACSNTKIESPLSCKRLLFDFDLVT